MPGPNRQHMYGDAYYFDGQFFFYTQTDTRVPNAETMIDETDGTLHMSAPELLVHNMFDIKKLAKWLDIEPTSVPPMLSRGQLVAPQFTVGSSPLWSRQVIEFWRQGRPGKGANLRSDAPQADKSDPEPLPATAAGTNLDSGAVSIPPGTPENVHINPQPQPTGNFGNVEVDEEELLAQIKREEEAEKTKAEAEAKKAAKIKAEAEAEVAAERKAKAEADKKAAANAK